MSFRSIHISSALAALSIAGLASAQQFIQQTATLFAGLINTEYSNQLTSVDIDGDGDLDIIWANGQGYNAQGAALKPRIWVNRINEPAAKFADETDARIPGVTGWFRGVEAGDCDGDGDQDLVLAQDFNKQPLLMINNGNGAFTNETATRLPVLLMSSARAQFGDVDNDGDLDLFFCNSGAANRFGSGQPRLFLNNGAGVYTNVTATNIPAGNIADQQDCIFADVDGDLDIDIHIGSRAGVSKLWLNNGAGVFTNSVIPGGGSTYSYDFGDIDGDGDMDLISIQGGSELLLQNNMPGVWTNISSEISPNTAIDDNDSKFIDYDNDGDLDYMVGSLGSSERVFRNNGGVASDPGFLFTLVAAILPAVGDATLDLEVADYNGDGRLDVVTAQGESGAFTNKIYINTTGPVDTIGPKVIKTEQVTSVELGKCGGEAGPFTVRTVVYDSHSSDRGFYRGTFVLKYSVDGGDPQSVPMKWAGNSIWRGQIPPMGAGEVTYFVTATDGAGNSTDGDEITFDISQIAPLGDLNGDCIVDGSDLGELLSLWGTDDANADLNGDGIVDGSDLGDMLSNWS